MANNYIYWDALMHKKINARAHLDGRLSQGFYSRKTLHPLVIVLQSYILKTSYSIIKDVPEACEDTTAHNGTPHTSYRDNRLNTSLLQHDLRNPSGIR